MIHTLEISDIISATKAIEILENFFDSEEAELLLTGDKKVIEQRDPLNRHGVLSLTLSTCGNSLFNIKLAIEPQSLIIGGQPLQCLIAAHTA